MKRSVVNGVVAILLGLLGAQIGRGQGTTTFLSNIGQTPDGSNPVGSDSWLAAGFATGANPGGYALDAVQLEMADAVGNPGGFSVMIYAALVEPGKVVPGSSVGTLNGSTDPAASGSYTYTSPSSLVLLPSAEYYIVMTAGTAAANGTFAWNALNSYSYDAAGNWTASVTLRSGNGLPPSWTSVANSPFGGFSQFAINATAAPEPGTLGLLALGGLVFGLRRWNEKKRF